MNRKGFTLIELIATIALLAVIAIISFVSITKVIEQNKINNCETLVNNIKTAANEYVSDNRYKKSFVDGISSDYIKNIDAGVLTSGNYLSTPIINPFNKNEISPNDIIIKIVLNHNYSSQSVEITSPSVLLECKTN